jgi:hypothetical protein
VSPTHCIELASTSCPATRAERLPLELLHTSESPCSASCGPRTCSYQAGYPEEPAVSRGRRGGLEAEHHLVLRLHPLLACPDLSIQPREYQGPDVLDGDQARQADGARRLLRTGRAVELAVVRQAVALHRPPGTDRTSDAAIASPWRWKPLLL